MVMSSPREAHRPPPRPEQAGDCPKGGGLARAVRPDGVTLPLITLNEDPLQRVDRAVVDVEFLHLKRMAAPFPRIRLDDFRVGLDFLGRPAGDSPRRKSITVMCSQIPSPRASGARSGGIVISKHPG